MSIGSDVTSQPAAVQYANVASMSSTIRPIATYDFELRAIDGIGLTDVEMDSVLALLLGYVRSAAASHAAWMREPEATGQTDDEWWLSIAPTLEQMLDVDRYAVAVRVGTAATEQYSGLHDPAHAFTFGLERVLDGIAVLIEGS
jgi:hypothetical protein